MAAVKWIAGLGLACLLFFGGRSCGTSAGVDERADLQGNLKDAAAALTDARDSLRGCSTSLNAVNAQAEQEIEDAQLAAKEAAEAVAEAEQDAHTYRTRLQEMERDLAKAKRDPDCREALEATSCAALL